MTSTSKSGILCDELGINMVRAAVVGSHPRFVQMVRELILERLDPSRERLSLGAEGPWPDPCPAGCCLGPADAFRGRMQRVSLTC